MSDRLYSFKELTKIGSELFLLGDHGKRAANELVERTDRLLQKLSKEERDEWARQACLPDEE